MSNDITDSDVPNDVLDIYSKPEIKVTELKPSYHKELFIQLEGYGVDVTVVNAIRRTIMDEIPVYGIHRSNIKVEHKRNKCIYDNDTIYCQFESLPIFDIPNDFELESPQLYLNTPELKTEFRTFVQDIDLNSEIEPYVPTKKPSKIELTLSYQNTSNESRYVSTHDITLRIDDKVVDNYKKHPKVDIFGLRPGQEIHVKANAVLGIAKYNAIWEAATFAYHNEISPTKYTLKYETIGQLHQKDIYNKSLKILVAQLSSLQNYVEKTVKPVGGIRFEQTLKGVNDTLGGVITRTLQKCTLVRVASYVKEHAFIDSIIISFALEDESKDPVTVFLDALTYLRKLFTAAKLD